MAKKLKLSEKHGLQPVIPVCYYCGQEKQEIALLGAEGNKLAKKMGHEDGQLPMTAVLDYFPCDTCRKNGIAITEVESEGNQTPTGRRWLVSEEAVKHVLAEPKLSQVLQTRLIAIDVETAEKVGLHAVIGD